MQLAIAEAVAGFVDEARRRVQKADADGILGDTEADDRMVVAAIVKDAAAARALLPVALEQQKKQASPGNLNTEGERAIHALLKIAEGKPAEAAAGMDPLTFRSALTDVVDIWALAKFQSGDFAAAARGYDFLTSKDARQGLSASQPFSWLMRGRTYARLGQTEEARKSYQRFFDHYKDADPDVPLLLQAREEFARLGS
jgi:tetratricopeptide (TPR) repeat protein